VNGAQITFTTPATPVWQALICAKRPGDAAYHIAGVTDPILANYGSQGYSNYDNPNPLVNTWTDYGQTMTTVGPNGTNSLASYFTDSLCTAGSVTNEFLTTTITSGAGSTTITVADAASNTASGTITSDNAPAFLAADAVSFSNNPFKRGTVYIPNMGTNTAFKVHSPVLLNSFVDGAGNIQNTETITFKNNTSGRLVGALSPQFSFTGDSYINSLGAYPTVIQDCDGCNISAWGITGGTGGKALLAAKTNNSSFGPYMNVTSGANFSADYCGIALELAGAPFNYYIQGLNQISSGPNQSSNSSWCPAVYAMGSITSPSILFIQGALSMQSRGLVANGYNGNFSITQQGNIYAQGCVIPPINIHNVNLPVYSKGGSTACDTSIEPNYSMVNQPGPVNPSPTMNISGCTITSNDTGGQPPCFQGTEQAIPTFNLLPNAPGSAIPAVHFAPGMVGIGKGGLLWASTLFLTTSSSAPSSNYGVNYFVLGADGQPAVLLPGSNTKYFQGLWNSTTPLVHNNCVKSVIVSGITLLADSGGTCGNTPPGPSLSTIINNSGVFGAVPAPTVPANVPQSYISTPSTGDIATTPVFSLAGVPWDKRTTTTENIKATNRINIVTFNNAGSVASNLPQAGSGGGTDNDFTHNFPFIGCNLGAGTATITPTTSTLTYVNGGSVTTPANIPLNQAQCALFYSDNTNYLAVGLGATGVTSLTDGGVIYSNSSSTGNVTLTPLTKNANTVFAGPTSGGAAAPTFRAIVAADLPCSGQACLTIANAASTGTTLNTLTKVTGAPSTAIVSAITDTGHVLGICISNCTTSGNATIQLTGSVSCVFDGATVANDYVQISSLTAGNCHDTGSTSYPTSGQVIGTVLSTNAAAGTYTIALFGPEDRAASSLTGSSNVTNQSTSQGTVTLASGPSVGQYRITYNANQNALCATGSNSVSFTFNWTDAGNARSLTTGSLPLGTAQSSTTGFLTGLFSLQYASGNVTYTSTVSGICASGTSSYDIHVALERVQ